MLQDKIKNTFEDLKAGDLVGVPMHPEDLYRVGLIIAHDEVGFTIQWIWYDKEYYIDREMRDYNLSYLLKMEEMVHHKLWRDTRRLNLRII